MKIIRTWRMYVKEEVDLQEFEGILKNFGWLVDGNIVFDCGYRRECHFKQIYKDKFVKFNKMVKEGEKA